ncbi:MAG: hypothetical protein DCC71_06415 [Proteobacteria bacterium]|nr:MAG: hypothetical protein DCC71_06415 [Pseudomonadota bacterium]
MGHALALHLLRAHRVDAPRRPSRLRVAAVPTAPRAPRGAGLAARLHRDVPARARAQSRVPAAHDRGAAATAARPVRGAGARGARGGAIVSEARVPESIARAVREDILRGRYRPGDRLPSERELAQQAGANRGSAREALKILAQQRLIEIRPGGARVGPLHQARLDVLRDMIRAGDGADPALMAQLLDVHELLLAGAARLAAERASDDELARAVALLGVLSDPEREADYPATLVSLIEGIAEASHNLVLRMVGNGLLVILASVVPVMRRLRPPHATLVPAVRDVRAALEARDAARAEQAVRALLRIKREHVLKQLERGALEA